MDPYDSWSGRRHTTHQDHVLDVIKEYHYFAPAMMLARSATHVRPQRDAEGDHWEDLAEETGRSCVPMQAVRMRLGALLIRVGTHLQRGPTLAPGVSTATVAASDAGG